jgi:hypothetical protein
VSLLKALQQIVSPRAMADEILRLQFDACIAARDLYPGAAPHVWLAHAYVSRLAARTGPMTIGQAGFQDAFWITFGFALLEWPSSVRALGHFIIEQEQPTIPKLLPEYAREAAELAALIENIKSSGYALARYKALNPGIRVEPHGGRLHFFPEDQRQAVKVEMSPSPSPSPSPPPPPLPPPPISPAVWSPEPRYEYSAEAIADRRDALAGRRPPLPSASIQQVQRGTAHTVEVEVPCHECLFVNTFEAPPGQRECRICGGCGATLFFTA